MNAIEQLAPSKILQSDFSIRLTQALLHFLWQAAAIGLAVVVLNHCLRKASSRLRYGVNVLALLLMLGCLPITLAVVSAPSQPKLARTEPSQPTPAVENSDVETTSAREIVIRGRGQNDDPAIAPVPAAAKPASGGHGTVVAGTSDDSTDATEVTLASRLAVAAPYTAALYLFGVAAMLLRVLIALRGGHRLRRESTPIEDATLLTTVAAQARRIGLKTAPAVARCARLSVPVVVGILRPMILLPASLATGLSPRQLQALLTHELAHIRRYDLVVNLLQRLAESLLFFHPAVWYVSRRLSDERENCCDDLVLASGCQRVEYADALVRMAELCVAGGPFRNVGALAASGDRPSQFKRRVLRVLGVPAGSQMRLTRAALFSVAFVPAAFLFAMSVLPGRADIQPGVAKADVKGKAAARKPPSKRNNAASKSETKRKPSSKNYTFEITVTGRAIDQKGKPIAGAKIYLASRRVEEKRLAETTTNKQGRYAFEDIALPIERAIGGRGTDYGAFEVFGQADGYGFAWRPEKTFAPKGMPKEPENLILRADEDLPTGYSPADKIVLDLKFPPPARLSGRIVDDRGKPVAGAEIAIRSCDPVPVGGYRSEQELRTFYMTRSLNCINERSTVPPEMKIRKTDAEGRFEFTGMPPNCRLWIWIRAKGFPDHRVFAATQKGAKKYQGGQPLYTDGMKITFATPRDVPIQVVYGDTGKPAAKVVVYGTVQNYSLYSQKVSDANGRVTLRLPKGQRRLILYPATGTPYLLTELPLNVRDKPDAKPAVIRLRRAAEVEVTVLDADTGKGIAGVDLWREQVRTDSAGTVHTFRGLHEFRSIEIKPKYRISHVHRPVTSANGKMRGLFEPGRHRIGIALERLPKGYKPVEKDGIDVDCKAGKTTGVTFHMRNIAKKPKPPAAPVFRKFVHPWIVVAKHVVFYEGKPVAWDDVRERLKDLADNAYVQPTIYFTNQSWRSPKRAAILKTLQDWGFSAHATGRFYSDDLSRQYDAVKSPDDLKPDPKARRRGRILLPNGKPASSADVLLFDERAGGRWNYEVYVDNGRFRDPWSLTFLRSTADKSGAFVCYPDGKRFQLAVFHTDGFALVNSDDFARSSTIRLQPWGRIAGSIDLTRDRRQVVQFASVLNSPGWCTLHFYDWQAPVANNGTFSRARLVPGAVRVMRGIRAENNSVQDFGAGRLQLKPGELQTVRVDRMTESERTQAAAFREKNQEDLYRKRIRRYGPLRAEKLLAPLLRPAATPSEVDAAATTIEAYVKQYPPMGQLIRRTYQWWAKRVPTQRARGYLKKWAGAGDGTK